MRIFLAGATGAIGRALLPLLVRDGHDVVGTTRSPAKTAFIRSLGGEPVVVDVFERNRLFEVVRAARPDAVIHQLTDLLSGTMGANARVRVEGTRNLVDAAVAAGVTRMVAESISFCYAAGDNPATEAEPLDLAAQPPRLQTVLSVQALEQTVQELPEGVVLRYGSLYGPGTWFASDSPRAEQVRLGNTPATDNVTSFVHVIDAAAAAIAALAWPAGVVNICDDEPALETVWLPVYAAALHAPTPRVQPGRNPTARGASNRKARQELHWQPVYPTWREGFRAAPG